MNFDTTFSGFPTDLSAALPPGRDFGQADPARYIRFSTASSMAQLQEAVARLERVLG